MKPFALGLFVGACGTISFLFIGGWVLLAYLDLEAEAAIDNINVWEELCKRLEIRK